MLGPTTCMGATFGCSVHVLSDSQSLVRRLLKGPVAQKGRVECEIWEEIELLWAVYDSGDGVLDSTAIIDNFRWIAKPGVPVSTNPVPK